MNKVFLTIGIGLDKAPAMRDIRDELERFAAVHRLSIQSYRIDPELTHNRHRKPRWVGDLDKAQAAAVAGGIQQHSVGAHYPFALVGRGGGGASGFWWEVHNLQDGTRAGSERSVRAWDRAEPALAFMDYVKNSNRWFDRLGRPIDWIPA